MSSRTRYTDEPIAAYRVVPDYLPPPEQLAFRNEGVEVTIALSKRSVDFFKLLAAKNRTQYPRMIRQLLDAYAPPPARRTAGSTRKPTVH